MKLYRQDLVSVKCGPDFKHMNLQFYSHVILSCPLWSTPSSGLPLPLSWVRSQSDTYLLTLLMNCSHSVWPWAATWPCMFFNTHILGRQHCSRWKTQAIQNDLRLAWLNTTRASTTVNASWGATCYCGVKLFLKSWDFYYSIILIKRPCCQKAFVIQALKSILSPPDKGLCISLSFGLCSLESMCSKES